MLSISIVSNPFVPAKRGSEAYEQTLVVDDQYSVVPLTHSYKALCHVMSDHSCRPYGQESYQAYSDGVSCLGPIASCFFVDMITQLACTIWYN